MNLAGSPEASLLADLLRCGHVSNYDATIDLSPALVRVVRSARKGDIRDLDFESKPLVQGLRGVYISAYGGGEPFYTTKQKSEIRIFLRIIVRLPEFVESTAKFFFDHVLVDVVLRCLTNSTEKKNKTTAGVGRHDVSSLDRMHDGRDDEQQDPDEIDDERNFLGEMLYLSYQHHQPTDHRAHLRTSLSVVLLRTASMPTRKTVHCPS